MTVIVSVVAGKTITASKDLAAGKSVRPVRIKAIKGGKYLLTEDVNGVAPENITVKRVGSNLHVALEGSAPDQPELIIESFFDHDGELVGLAEDGEYHAYIAVDGDGDSSAMLLLDGVSSPLALGSAPLLGFGNGLAAAGGGLLPWALAGLGLVGAGVAIDRHNSGGKKPVDTLPPDNKGIGEVLDDTGAVQGSLDKGGVTDDDRPTVGGSGQTPGDRVTVIDNGKIIGEVIVDRDGEWSFTPEQGLGEGEHAFEVIVTDPSGNSSQPSDDFTVIIDTTAPTKPVIESIIDDAGSRVGIIAHGEVTDDATPTLTGKAEAGSTVHVYANGALLGSVQVGSDGSWRFTPDSPLADGEYGFSVTSQDAAGNISVPSDIYALTLDGSAPSKPRAGDAQLIDDAGPVTGPITNGMTTDDDTPTFTGKAEPGTEVVIYDNGKEIGRAPVDDAGSWTFTPGVPLAEGDHSLNYEVVDKAGNSSEPSDPIGFTVDTTAPGKPGAGDAQLIDDAGPVTGPITNGMTTDDDTPTFNGKAEPGAEVVIYDNGDEIGRVPVDGNGNWTFTPQVPLDDGDHSLNYVVVDEAGNAGEGSDPIGFTVDTTAPAKPSIERVHDDQGDVTGDLVSGQETDDAKPTLSGSAEPGSTLIIRDVGAEIGRVQVDAQGKWSFEPARPLANGPHAFTAQAVDAAGNAGPESDVFNLVLVNDDRPAAPAITAVIDDVGTVQGNLQKNAITDDARPTVHGTSQAGMTISLYSNGKLLGTTTVDDNGDWRFTPDSDLADGLHNITAKATNAVGNASPETGSYPITVDTVAPSRPGAGDAELIDNQGQVTGPIVDGSITDDNTPTFEGKAEPNATVVIHDNGREIGRVPTDAAGNWQFTPTPPLADGAHSLSYEVIDAAGNSSGASDPIGFAVDTGGVDIAIGGADDNVGALQGAIAPGGMTDDTTPTLHGTASAGGVVKIYEGDTLLGQVTADAEGKWRLELPVALGEGAHSLQATVTTDVNGESAKSSSFDFIIDVSVPVQPVIGSIGDDVGSVQGTIAPGGSTDDTTPTLKGNAEAGSTVHIYDNGSLLGSVQAGSNGVWGFTPTTPLNNGPHDFTVTSEDKAGNVSAPSEVYNVIVDTVAPGRPTIDSVHDDEGDQTGPLASGDLTDDAKPAFTGSAEPNSTVIIHDNGVEIGRAPVAADGSWSFVPALPLGNGMHDLTVEAVDAAGNVSAPSDTFVLDVLSGGTPAMPAITGLVDDVGAIKGNLQKNDVTDDARPTINGTADPGVTVSLHSNGTLLGSVLVDPKGEWSFTPSVDLVDGLHNITAKATNAVGNASPETGSYPITVDTAAPGKPGLADAELLDNEGQVTGPIRSGDVTDDSTPTFIGKAEPNGTVVILDNGKEIGRAPTDKDGNWEFTPTTPLAEGEHSLSYEVIDKAGNVGAASDPVDFTVDTGDVVVTLAGANDNVGKVQGAIAAGGVTDDATPTLHGRAEAGGLVKIYEGGTLLGQVLADAEGNWSLELPVALGEGMHSLHATVTTEVNGEMGPSGTFTFSVDLSAPGKPAITEVSDDVGHPQGVIGQGQPTDDTTPTLKGNAEAGSTVHIHDNGSLLGSVVAGANGVWSFTPTTPLNNGPHDFTATSEDKAGNLSAPSEVYNVIIDTVAPGRATIDSVHDDEGSQTGFLSSGDLTDDAKPELTGSAEPNSTVIIKDNGVEIGRAPVAADGTWSFVPALPLGNGAHDLTAEAVDAAGNIGQPSEKFVLEVLNDGAPNPPAIQSVVDDVGALKGNLQKGDVTDDARPTISGTAEPGVTVSLYSNGTLLGAVLANTKGEWSFTPSVDLADGLHNITAKATNSVGNDSAETGDYPITVDTVAPAKPGAGDADLVDNEGSIQGSIVHGSTTDDSTPTFFGSNAEPDATVVIYDNGKEIGRVPTNAIGGWEFTPAPALLDGSHSFNYQVVDKAGNSGEKSDPIAFTLDSSAVTVRIEGAIDNVGAVTGELANGGVTDDATPTLHGKATAGGVVKLYDGNNALLGETTADAEGRWTFTPASPLPEGAVTLYATVTTSTSAESEKTPAFHLILDMTAPLKPVIETIEDDVGNPQGLLANGQSTDDTTPTLSGKAEAGSTVRIHDNGSLLGSVVADGAGNWNFTPTTPLNNGPHSFTVTSVDPAGNASAPSDAYAIVVDTVAPARPTIDVVYDDQGSKTGELLSGDDTDDDRPVLSGSAEPHSTVVIKDKGVEIGRAPVDADGTWTFEPGVPLAKGEHSLTVEAVDPAGNTSQPSSPFVLQVDASGAGKPVITEVFDDQGPKQGLLSDGDVTDDVRPRITGTAKPGSTVTLYDDHVEIGSVPVDAYGNWSFTPTTALQNGAHSIHVTAVDSLGGAGEASDPFAFEVSTDAPTAPNISNIRDDVGLYQGILRNGGTTDDTRPTVHGTGQPGDTIEIRASGVTVGTGVVGEDGRWIIASTVDLGQGVCVFTAVAVSPSGVESAQSGTYQITVDTIAPEVPIITSVVDNAGNWKGELNNGDFTDDRTPTFNGTAEPNTTIEVFDGGEYIGDAVVDANGNWSYTPNKTLSYGEHLFTFLAFDRAFNQSELTEEWSILVGAPIRSATQDDASEALPSASALLAESHVDILDAPAASNVIEVAPTAGMDVAAIVEALAQEGAGMGGFHAETGFHAPAQAGADNAYLLETALAS